MSIPDATTLRILDANFNRAREALRVLEEFARFGLEDADATRLLKEMRHALLAAVPQPIRSSMMLFRDTPGDVGCGVATPSEYHRADVTDVVRAAAARLSEALRAIEEYGKTIDPAFAAAVERLRYQTYTIEQRLVLGLRAHQRFGEARLYVILTESLCTRPWLETAQAVLLGGADAIQLREKSLADREMLGRTRRLAEMCHEHGAILIVNDRVDVAIAGGADGVHLGQCDMPVPAARRILPDNALVGVSTHLLEEVNATAKQNPDYIAVGPMFPTTTKHKERIAGPVRLAEARRHTGLPLVAIGGINATNIDQVLAAALCCVCVCSAVIGQADPRGAAEALRNHMMQKAVSPESM